MGYLSFISPIKYDLGLVFLGIYYFKPALSCISIGCRHSFVTIPLWIRLVPSFIYFLTQNCQIFHIFLFAVYFETFEVTFQDEKIIKCRHLKFTLVDQISITLRVKVVGHGVVFPCYGAAVIIIIKNVSFFASTKKV